MTDAERIDLACKVLAIANEARSFALASQRFHERDWATIDIYADEARRIGRCAANAIALRARASWYRDRASIAEVHGLVRQAQYSEAMAGFLDRAAALHEESATTT